MSEISFKEIHALCLVTTQQIVDGLGWDTIVVTVLNDIDEARLTAGLLHSRLNWAWAIAFYREGANDSIIKFSLRDIEHGKAGALHAAIICKHDARREMFSICMMENFIVDRESALTGKVALIALIYAITFCQITGLNYVYIQDPLPEALPWYRTYGFAPVWYDHSKVSAEVEDILHYIRLKIINSA